MFTVVLGDSEVLAGINKYKLFLEPLLQKEKLTFCEWFGDAESLDTMVPDLYTAVKKHKEWRAVIVIADSRTRQNPFDFSDYSEKPYNSRKIDWDFLISRRKTRFTCYEKAIQNPTTKLTMALCGAPVHTPQIMDMDLYNSLVDETKRVVEVMLESKLNLVNVNELVKLIKKQGNPKLDLLVGAHNVKKVLEMLTDKDVNGLIEHVGMDKIINFLRMLGAVDPQHLDPEYYEFMIENTKKEQLLSEFAATFKLKLPMPSEVLMVALRDFTCEHYEADVSWSNYNEQEYSRFSEFNLYNDKLKYLIFDINEPDHIQYEFEYLRFLYFLLVLSQNNIPQGVLTKNRVFSVDCVSDESNLSYLLTLYDEKLKITMASIKEKQAETIEKDNKRISTDKFVEMLEVSTAVPLLIDPNFDMKSLEVEHSQLGLAKDCPKDEEAYFSTQFFKVKKGFQKFFKQPRRALIKATEYIRHVNAVDGDEAMYINNFQLEDVMDSIDEAEMKMISTVTANIYDTKRYFELMDETKKKVDAGIETRMVKKTAILSGIIMMAAFLLGFIPLFISNRNTAGSFSFSAILTAASLAILVLAGLCCLFWLKRKLVKLFKLFNKAMNNIVIEVNAVMKKFSEYLTHACKFMRGFSAINRLNESEKTGSREYKIFEKHLLEIEQIRSDNRVLFSEIGLIEKAVFDNLTAYEHDFQKLTDYEYKLPFGEETANTIEFLQKGNYVDVPVSYIRSITLRREELFDV